MTKYKKGISEPFWRKNTFWGWVIPVFLTIIALYLAYPSYVADSRENEEIKTIEKIITSSTPPPDPCDFPSKFDSTHLYILITRFEDNVNTGFETKCYGYSILSRIDQIKNDSNLRIKICYVDKYPPKQSDDAIRLRDQYHADVIIWGKLRDAEPGCQAGGFCIKFQPSDTLVRYAGGKLSPKVDNEYQPNVSDKDLEEGLIKMGDVSFTAWVLSMWNLKIARKKPEFYKVASDLPAEKQAEEYARRANMFFQLGLLEKTIRDYDQAIRLKPSFIYYYRRGVAHAKLSKHQEALKDFAKAAKLNPNDANTYYNMGKSFSFLGLNQESIATYNQAIKLDANHSNAYNTRGGVKKRLRQYEAAIADFDKAIQINPNNVNAYNNRGAVKDDLGQYEAAIADFDKAIQINPNNVNAYCNRAFSKNKLGQNNAAISDLDKAIRIDPNNVNAYNGRASIKYEMGRYKAAISDLNKAIQFDSNYAQSYIGRGTVELKLGQYESAVTDFNKAIRLNLNIPAAYVGLGDAKNRLGQYSAAIADLNKAIQLDPKSFEAYALRGVSRSGLGQYETAMTDFDKSVKIKPNIAIFTERGIAESGLKRYKEAIVDFNKAIQFDAGDFEAYKNRGDVYWKEGRYLAAIADSLRANRLKYLPSWRLYAAYMLIIGLFIFWRFRKKKKTFTHKRKQVTSKNFTRQIRRQLKRRK